MQEKNVKPRLVLLLGLSALNVIAGVYLSRHFYEIRGGSAAFKSVCSVNAVINCDQVAGSSFAELMMGFPLAGFVAGWYLAVAILAALSFAPAWRKAGVCAISVMAGVSCAFSLFYTGVMVFVVHSLCLFCLGISFFDFVALFLALSFRPWASARAAFEATDVTHAKQALALALACVVAVPVGLNASFAPAAEAHQAQLDEAVKGVLASPVVEVDTKGPSFGPADAPVTIVEFSDFQCPFCKRGALTMHSLMSRYAGKIRLVFKNYPLDTACNQGLKEQMHPMACEAARAAYCAGQQGKFAEIYEKIFDEQESLAPGKPAEMAAAVGADRKAIDECMAGFQTNLAILGDIDQAERLGIQQSAPTFFVNGHRLDGAYPMAAWEKIIPALLK